MTPLRPYVEGAHHAPLDQRRIEWRFELREKLLALGFCELRCGHTYLLWL